MKFLLLIALIFLGCAGIGADKRVTLIPDEMAISQETTPDKENTWKPSKIIVNVRWKIEKPKEAK